MIPLASDLLIRFREQIRREGLLASASTPNRLSPFSRIGSVDRIIQDCPEVTATSVQKVAWRDKQATVLLTAYDCNAVRPRRLGHAWRGW